MVMDNDVYRYKLIVMEEYTMKKASSKKSGRNTFCRFILGIITFAIIIVLSLCFTSKAKGAGIQQTNLTGAAYLEIESQYTSQVREILNSKGFCNAGINLDKVTSEHGSLIYTLSIRHRRFDKMDDSKKADLKECIEGLTLDVRSSKVSVIFIE